MRGFLAWFGKRREERAHKLLGKHLEATARTLSELLRAVESLARGEKEHVREHLALVARHEEEGDHYRREVIRELATADVPEDVRSDLMELAKRIDLVADWSHETGRVIAILLDEGIDSELYRRLHEMVKRADEAVKLLVRAYDILYKEPREALDLCDRVERIEEEVDDLYREARRYLLTIEFENPALAVLAYALLDTAENLVDRCEEVGDQLRVLAVKAIPA